MKTLLNGLVSLRRVHQNQSKEYTLRKLSRVIRFYHSPTEEAVTEVLGDLSSRLSLFVVHRDTQHIHVHFLSSSVNDNGLIFSKRADDLQWHKALDRLEMKHKLVRVKERGYEPGKAYPKPKSVKPSHAPFPQAKRKPSKHKISDPAIKFIQDSLIEGHQLVIDWAVENCRGNFKSFVRSLGNHSMRLIPNMSKEEGLVRGMSFELNGETFKGRDLGRKYQWGQLKKLIGYEDANHKEILWRAKRVAERSSFYSVSIEPVTEEHKAQVVSQPTQSVRSKISKRCVLYTKFTRKSVGETTTYYWKSTGAQAFTESKGNISTPYGANNTVIKAMLQRAKERGWTSVRVRGSKAFQLRVAIAARNVGIEVSGSAIPVKTPVPQPVKKAAKATEPSTATQKSVDTPVKEPSARTKQPSMDIPEGKPAASKSKVSADKWGDLDEESKKKVDHIAKVKFQGNRGKAVDWYFIRRNEGLNTNNQNYNND